MKNSIIVIDLDGVLADRSHRKNLFDRDLVAWNAACSGDKPIWPMIRLARALMNSGQRTEFWTGRPESARAATIEWLFQHGLSAQIPLRMRGAGDERPSLALKRMWLKESVVAGRPVAFAFEDRPEIVTMYRAEGVTCAAMEPEA